MLHLEFTVLGPPVSHQTKDKANLRAWKQTIRDEARKKWTTIPLTTKLKMLLINFHEGDDAPLDDDNMVKPIRDAMNDLVYADDRQITYSELIQVGIDAPIKVRKGSRILLDAYARGDEFLYIRIEDAPDFIQLPQ
jgi:crossover junction endodeoxyribonuclease RusA